MSQDSSVYVKGSNLSQLISLFAIWGLKSIYFVSPLVYFCHFLVSYVAFYIYLQILYPLGGNIELQKVGSPYGSNPIRVVAQSAERPPPGHANLFMILKLSATHFRNQIFKFLSMTVP